MPEKNVLEVLKKIQGDSALAKQFMKDPQGTLTAQGLDASKLKISRTTDSRAIRTTTVAEKRIAADLTAGRLDALDSISRMKATVCGSVGYIVCGSVGD